MPCACAKTIREGISIHDFHMGLHILSTFGARDRTEFASHIDERIQRAHPTAQSRVVTIETHHRRTGGSRIAHGYSSFRQAFKAQNGLSPEAVSLQIASRRRTSLSSEYIQAVGEIDLSTRF